MSSREDFRNIDGIKACFMSIGNIQDAEKKEADQSSKARCIQHTEEGLAIDRAKALSSL